MDQLDATLFGKDGKMTEDGERTRMKGKFVVECVGADGKVKWRDEFHNTVVTVGKNLALDTLLAGSSYSVTGPYMGLISSTSYSAISASDTMSSHAGWLEAGNANAPTYTSPRKTAVWSAACWAVRSAGRRGRPVPPGPLP